MLHRDCTLVDDIGDEYRTDKEGKWIEELIDLSCTKMEVEIANEPLLGKENDVMTYHCPCHIWMGSPNMPLHEEGPQVGTPCIPCPPQDLFKETPVWLHGTEKFGFLAALDVSAPTVADHPSSKELVVTGIELVLSEPVIVCEAV